jgi:hypothetical protein
MSINREANWQVIHCRMAFSPERANQLWEELKNHTLPERGIKVPVVELDLARHFTRTLHTLDQVAFCFQALGYVSARFWWETPGNGVYILRLEGEYNNPQIAPDEIEFQVMWCSLAALYPRLGSLVLEHPKSHTRIYIGLLNGAMHIKKDPFDVRRVMIRALEGSPDAPIEEMLVKAPIPLRLTNKSSRFRL